MLLKKRNANQCTDCQSQHHEPDSAERLHERADDAVVPAFRKMLQFTQIISNATDLVRSVGLVAEALPKTRLEDVLVDGRANSYADCAS